MCIAVRALEASQRNERPLDGDKAGDDLDGFGLPLVGIGPASNLVEVVPDARCLPGALALDLGRAGRPRPRARHGPPDQRGQGYGCGLGPPSGELGRRYAGGDDGAAAVRHHAAPTRGEGGGAPFRDLYGSATRGGFEGGREPPRRQPRCVTTGRLLPALSGVRKALRRRVPEPSAAAATPASAPANPFNGPREAGPTAAWRPAMPGRPCTPEARAATDPRQRTCRGARASVPLCGESN